MKKSNNLKVESDDWECIVEEVLHCKIKSFPQITYLPGVWSEYQNSKSVGNLSSFLEHDNKI